MDLSVQLLCSVAESAEYNVYIIKKFQHRSRQRPYIISHWMTYMIVCLQILFKWSPLTRPHWKLCCMNLEGLLAFSMTIMNSNMDCPLPFTYVIYGKGWLHCHLIFRAQELCQWKSRRQSRAPRPFWKVCAVSVDEKQHWRKHCHLFRTAVERASCRVHKLHRGTDEAGGVRS